MINKYEINIKLLICVPTEGLELLADFHCFGYIDYFMIMHKLHCLLTTSYTSFNTVLVLIHICSHPFYPPACSKQQWHSTGLREIN